jgi:hypothetical protein
MDTNYLEILDKVTLELSDIEDLYKKTQSAEKSFENREANQIVDNLISTLDRFRDRLKRISLPVVEGRLQEQENNKFNLIRSGTSKSIGYNFSCGSYLEVWDNEEKEWQSGSVEHTTKNGQTGYYFINSDMGNPFLYTGMKARVRKDI